MHHAEAEARFGEPAALEHGYWYPVAYLRDPDGYHHPAEPAAAQPVVAAPVAARTPEVLTALAEYAFTEELDALRDLANH